MHTKTASKARRALNNTAQLTPLPSPSPPPSSHPKHTQTHRTTDNATQQRTHRRFQSLKPPFFALISLSLMSDSPDRAGAPTAFGGKLTPLVAPNDGLPAPSPPAPPPPPEDDGACPSIGTPPLPWSLLSNTPPSSGLLIAAGGYWVLCWDCLRLMTSATSACACVRYLSLSLPPQPNPPRSVPFLLAYLCPVLSCLIPPSAFFLVNRIRHPLFASVFERNQCFAADVFILLGFDFFLNPLSLLRLDRFHLFPAETRRWPGNALLLPQGTRQKKKTAHCPVLGSLPNSDKRSQRTAVFSLCDSEKNTGVRCFAEASFFRGCVFYGIGYVFFRVRIGALVASATALCKPSE